MIRLAFAWLAYAALHSVLASTAVKSWAARRWAGSATWYRSAYNAVAVITAIPLAWLVYAADGAWLWRWTGAAAWGANALALAALAGIAFASRAYDMRAFLGFRQAKHEAFAISPIHRFVRHPWYFFSLVLVWTRDMNAAWLLSCSAITLYFAVGSRLEEKKLLAAHGEAYRRYMERVPGLLPLPWKFLTEAEAREIAAQ